VLRAADVTPELTASDLRALVPARRGHFVLESGYHTGLWLDLDALFANPRAIAPFVERLATRLRAYEPHMVCGPLLGGALLAQSLATVLGADFSFTRPGPAAPGSGLYRARYLLPAALRDRVRNRRVALVDDVMSAGSSLRATCEELRSQGAIPVAVGALMVLGEVGERHFRETLGLSVEAVVRDQLEVWVPSECALCARGVPLEHPTATPE
jgi:orotate phosphoribosyltransferase